MARLKTTAAASQLDALVALCGDDNKKDVDAPPLTAREHRGLAALIEACGAWAGDETACDDRERPFLTLAAEAVGCTSATELVAAAREALAAVPEPKPKFTIKLQRAGFSSTHAPFSYRAQPPRARAGDGGSAAAPSAASPPSTARRGAAPPPARAAGASPCAVPSSSASARSGRDVGPFIIVITR